MPNPEIQDFSLSSAFDAQFLLDMHDNDLAAISEILATSYQQIKAEWEKCLQLVPGGNQAEIKRRIHLVKPLWGFCGLPQMQMKYQLLESFLLNNPGLDLLKSRMQQEAPHVNLGLQMIDEETRRIQEFLNIR